MGGSLPARLRYNLQAPTDDTLPINGQVTLLAVADITDEFARGIDAVEDLQPYLIDGAEVPPVVMVATGMGEPPIDSGFPRSPLFFGARRMLVAQQHILDFQGGRGVAMIAFYAQDIVPLVNTSPVYSFVGLTDDGRYLISWRFEVTTDALPESYSNNFGLPQDYNAQTWINGGYLDYYRTTADRLNALDTAAFDPDLAIVDGIIRSLYVKPGWEDTLDE